MNRESDEEKTAGASKVTVRLGVDDGSPDVLSVAFPNDEFERVLRILLDALDGADVPEGCDPKRISDVFLSNRDKLVAPTPRPVWDGVIYLGCAVVAFFTLSGFVAGVSLFIRSLWGE